jgi:glucosamine--fructose-6-phosphate aminotransferase (isomerizing)
VPNPANASISGEDSVTSATHFLQDIIRQRNEMPRTLEYLQGDGEESLRRAESLLSNAAAVFLTGIGASWNAALCAGSLFQQNGRPVYMQEAGDLLHFTALPADSVIVAISRTGRSIEIVQLLDKAEAAGARVVGVTNVADSPLARRAEVALVIPALLDHAISVNAYSSLLIAAGALAYSEDAFVSIGRVLCRAFEGAGKNLEVWQKQLEKTSWLEPKANYYFLARGGSFGTCHQARLLWEEAAKMPATSMSTSGFRHGPQEIVRKGMRFCLWIDQQLMRDADLAVARDLRELGASVMLIGEGLPSDDADLVCQLPTSPPHWQFAIDMLPIQLAAERLSRLRGVDCDSFRICSYVVEDEYGLAHKKAEAPSAD